MEDIKKLLNRLSETLSYLLTFFAAFGIFSLMASVFVSVFFRYVLNKPILGTEDLMSLLLGMTIFTAFPAVTLARTHITVDLLNPLFRRVPTLDRLRLALIDLGMIAITLFMAKRIWDQAARYQKRGTVSNAMDWPLYPYIYLFSALLALAALLLAIRALQGLSSKSETGEMSL